MIIAKKRESLTPLIELDAEKCVNCHACITVCPVKYCNNGSLDHVEVNHDLCIGCGTCIKRCTHKARTAIDDFDLFMNDAKALKGPFVAIVAPSVVANFGDDYLRLNGWLREFCGVEAVFDVSFGAELTVKSYVEHIKKKNPETIIAQPCPAIVNYIELYLPELLSSLIPVDSPMVHTMKMIKEFFPQYADHRIVVISPCLAKKREFVSVGIGDYNVSFTAIRDYFDQTSKSLSSFPPVEYVNPAPERAVLFSTPGGLLETAKRWIPDIGDDTRKLEGPGMVYEYLSHLSDAIHEGIAPKLVDCLNCEFGCNGGPFTFAMDTPRLDEVENRIEKRRVALTQKHQTASNTTDDVAYQNYLDTTLSAYWKEGLYERRYRDRSMNNRVDIPPPDKLAKIYTDMHKYTETDMFNCSSCGYERCENMAIAIYNGLNKPENCHFYLAEKASRAQAVVTENENRLRTVLSNTAIGLCIVDPEMNIILVNGSLCSMFGTTKDRMMGTALFKAQFQKALSLTPQTIEFRVNQSEGKYINCLFNANEYKSTTGELLGYFAMVTDITAAKN